MNFKIQTGSCRAALRCYVAFSRGINEAKKGKNRAINQKQYFNCFFHNHYIGILINNFRCFFDNLKKGMQQIDIDAIKWMLQKDHTKAGPVCNNKKCYQQHNHKRYGSFVEFCDGFIKTVAGDKQVHSHRRCKITYLHIG